MDEMIELKAHIRFADGTEQTITEDTVYIGRDKERCLLIISDDKQVSRVHAAIVRGGSTYFLQDENSVNGTYLNDRKLTNKMALVNGDVIGIGGTKLVFSTDAHATSSIPPRLDDGDRIAHTVILTRAGGSTPELFIPPGDDAPSQAKTLARLQTLYGLSEKLTTLRDINKLLSDVLEQVFKAVPVDRGTIFLCASDNSLDPVATRSRIPGEQEANTVSQSILDHVMKTREAVLIPDASLAEEFSSQQSVMVAGMRTVACIPMIVHGGVEEAAEDMIVGVLQVHTTHALTLLDQEDLKLLLGIGSLAAVAIVNSRLHAEQIQQNRLLELVHDLERALVDETPLDEFLVTVLDRVILSFEGNGGHLHVRSPVLAGESHIATHGLNEVHKKRIADLHSIRDEVLQTGDGRVDTVSDSTDGPGPDRIGSFVSCPILYTPEDGTDHGEVAIGVLQIVHPARTGLSVKTLSSLRIFGAQISTALHRKALLNSREENRRNAVIGRLANTVVHDLKNPMGLLKAYAGMINSDFLDRDGLKEVSQNVDDIADRCLSLVGGILSFVRGERGIQLEQVDSKDFMDSLGRGLSADAKVKGIRLRISQEFEGSLTLDVEKMKRVLFNLVGNAFEVLEPGGEVHVACRGNDFYVEFLVEDTGPGVPEEIRDTLFEPFVTMGKRQGTGLGLAIVHEIVGSHKGSITLDEDREVGAGFRIRIPRQSP